MLTAPREPAAHLAAAKDKPLALVTRCGGLAVAEPGLCTSAPAQPPAQPAPALGKPGQHSQRLQHTSDQDVLNSLQQPSGF